MLYWKGYFNIHKDLGRNADKQNLVFTVLWELCNSGELQYDLKIFTLEQNLAKDCLLAHSGPLRVFVN